MIKQISSLLLLVLISSVFAQAQSDLMEEGVIHVSRARDAEVVRAATGATQTLRDGMKVKEGDTVTTGKRGRVLLLFSNGSSVSIKPNTTMVVEAFQVEPYDAQALGNLAEQPGEPSTSVTRLNLKEGELIGNVKKLDPNGGSTYDIVSPVGTAGIRGTTWTMTIIVDVNNTIDGKFGIAEGSAIWVNLDGSDLTVGSKAAVTVVVETNDAGEVVSVQTVEAVPLSDEEAAEVVDQTKELEEILRETPPEELSQGEGGDDGNESQTPIILPPPPPIDEVDPTPTTGEGDTADSQNQGGGSSNQGSGGSNQGGSTDNADLP